MLVKRRGENRTANPKYRPNRLTPWTGCNGSSASLRCPRAPSLDAAHGPGQPLDWFPVSPSQFTLSTSSPVRLNQSAWRLRCASRSQCFRWS